MAYVLCAVEDGLRPSEATVGVTGFDNRVEYLRVERSFIREIAGHPYLPVGLIQYDEQDPGVALIELPHEADSGANRMWVRTSNLRGTGQERRKPVHDPV